MNRARTLLITGTLSTTKDGKVGEVEFSSDEEGAICITTLQLV